MRGNNVRPCHSCEGQVPWRRMTGPVQDGLARQAMTNCDKYSRDKTVSEGHENKVNPSFGLQATGQIATVLTATSRLCNECSREKESLRDNSPTHTRFGGPNRGTFDETSMS